MTARRILRRTSPHGRRLQKIPAPEAHRHRNTSQRRSSSRPARRRAFRTYSNRPKAAPWRQGQPAGEYCGLKAKVALAALREEMTWAALSKTYGIHPHMVSTWKRQPMETSANGNVSTWKGGAIAPLCSAFEGGKSDAAFDAARASEAEIETLPSKLGQLAVERDFWASASPSVARDAGQKAGQKMVSADHEHRPFFCFCRIPFRTDQPFRGFWPPACGPFPYRGRWGLVSPSASHRRGIPGHGKAHSTD